MVTKWRLAPFFSKFFFSTFCSLKLHFCHVILHILQYLLSCDCVILHCYHLIDKIRLSLVNITTPSQAERIFL
jgi:hypothetical protein